MPYQFDDFHLTLTFDVFPPSLNGNDGLLRMHWRQYTALRTEWEQRIWYALTPEHRTLFQSHWFARCALTYTRRTTHRTGLDWVNLAASLKIPEDALVRCGVLQDDNPAVVQTVLPQQQHVKHRREQGITLDLIGTVVPRQHSRPSPLPSFGHPLSA